MDITDFTRGIVTDVDEQDGGALGGGPGGLQGTVRDMVNFDPYPGRAVKRYGTKARTFTRRAVDPDPPLSIPGADEIITQIETVYVPTAKPDAVLDFPPASIRCTNTDVTVILVRHAVTGKYRLYHDGLDVNVFDYALTPDGTGWFDGTGVGDPPGTDPPNGDPFLIGRVSAVAIGNAKTFDPLTGTADADGVLWLGHVRRLACWQYNEGTTELEYMSTTDEWRLSNAECHDAGGLIQCRAAVSNYAAMWNANDTAEHPFYEQYAIPGSIPVAYYDPIDVLDEGLARLMLGREQRHFNIKVTAVYDGFQESRPLTWLPSLHETIEIKDEVNIDGLVYGKKELPSGWRLKSDAEHNQYLRVELGDLNVHAMAGQTRDLAEPFKYPIDNDLGGTTPLGGLTWRFELTWNATWQKDKYKAVSGEGFSVGLYWSAAGGPAASGETDITYQMNGYGSEATFTGVNILIRGADAHAMAMPEFLLFLLGQDPPEYEYIVQELQANPVGAPLHNYWKFMEKWHRITSWWEWKKCRELWSITYKEYGTDGDVYVGDPDPYYPIGDQFPNVGVLGWTFKVRERVGLGMLQIQPLVPRKLVLEANDSVDPVLFAGGRRLTGFRIYTREDDVDADYRLTSEVNLDYNVGDPDHGGTVEDPEDMIIGLRAGGFTGSAPSFYDDGTFIRPYLLSQQHWAPIVGGANRKFLVTDDALTDREGRALLSANMMRDETKRDAPTWKRGAVMNGRLFGIGYDGELEYCLMAGGVVQYDIRAGAFHVSDGEEITHAVSWRGQHHLVFTDQNLWRLSLGDGDELSWAILDSYVHQGTRLWKAIVDTPAGLLYPNESGIWLYDGNRPESVVKERWEREYVASWAGEASEAASVGGYEPSAMDVHLRLSGAVGFTAVWVFNLRTMGWRKYTYAGGLSPSHLARYRTAFLQVFGAGDLREHDRQSLTDLGNAYTAWLLTQDVPPVDQTRLSYWQYMGIRYLGPVTHPLALRVLYEPYDDYVLHNAKTITASGARHEYFFPLPLGISRNMRVLIGQGSALGMTDSSSAVIVSSISFRGAQSPQWSGTR